MTTTTTEKKIITLKGDAFIIPNTPCRFLAEHIEDIVTGGSDFTGSIVVKAIGAPFLEMCNINGVKLDDQVYFIQLWMTNNISDNWKDHGYRLGDDNEDSTWIHLNTCYVPHSLLQGKHEGDTVIIRFPGTISSSKIRRLNNGRSEEVIVECELRLNQKDYRYSGEFHEVFANGLKHAKETDNHFIRYKN